MKSRKIKKILIVSIFVFMTIFPFAFIFYMGFVNIHITKASYIRQLERQIEDNKNNNINEEDFRMRTKEYYIYSVEGQTLLLAVLKEIEPEYKFFTVGRRESGRIYTGNIELFYYMDTDSKYKEFRLTGKGINYFTLNSTSEALQTYFNYAESLESR
ncbi:MAG: hypothetical protein LBS21_15525 [Clostridiales bacterium]|jgi:hypothetical protein|nr:hypothetical protein [Clostridiales bacterium]